MAESVLIPEKQLIDELKDHAPRKFIEKVLLGPATEEGRVLILTRKVSILRQLIMGLAALIKPMPIPNVKPHL